MLCPEVSNFRPPKVISTYKPNQTLGNALDIVNMNDFYKSIVITCPDEFQTPNTIVELVTEDTEYYKIFQCPLVEFVESSFIANFVKTGSLHCLSVDRNCIIDNCAAITPDGMFTLHVLDYIYQTLGFEGVKRLHSYYEVKIDLKNIRHLDKIKQGLTKLGSFDFFINWEPDNEDICPSSIAKYFHDRSYKVLMQSTELKRLSPTVDSIPSIKDVEPDEMVEWVGMLAIEGDTVQDETYISTYGPPHSDYTIESNKVSVLIAKGLLTPNLVSNICRKVAEYVTTRELLNYWASLSVQSCDNSLWQWNPSSPKMFQSQDCSLTIFFTHNSHVVYSVGQLKYT